MRNISGVYIWVNLVNGKVYVGSSKFMCQRKANHIQTLRAKSHHNPHFQATAGVPAWNKGKTTSEETRKKQSKAQKSSWTPERRAAQAENMRNLKLNNPHLSHLAGVRGAEVRWKKEK
jgi:predicted GIY-YIG superfamily endonuclease